MKSSDISSSGSDGLGGGGGPGPGNPGNPAPVNPAFTAGSAFNYASLEAKYKSQMVEVMMTALQYSTSTQPRAIAIADNGLGFVRRQAAGVPQAEVNQLALQSCFAISGGKPCVLLAEGNVFSVGANELPSRFTFTMPAPAAALSASIPFLTASEGSAAFSFVTTQQKALAVGMGNNWVWSVGATIAEARRRAMERCELYAGITPCFVYAENNTVVFNPLNINRAPVIDYAKTTVATSIPGVSDAFFTSDIQNGYLTRVPPQAGRIYISVTGAIGQATDPANAASANTNAQNLCNNASTPDRPCFLYAVDRVVQPLPVAGKTLYGLDYHCKAIPRSTCAAHKAMGCGPGSYYTMTTGSPVLENCL